MSIIYQKYFKSAFALMICISFAVAKVALANDASEYQKNVDAIGKQIEEISKNLNTNKAKLKTQQDQLLALEQQISTLGKELQTTNSKIIEQKKEGEDLLTQIEQLDEQQQDDLEALSSLLVSRYTNGKSNYIKMLLNQENPYAVGRLNNYYEYFAQARQEKITIIRDQLQQLSSLQNEHTALLAELEQTQSLQKKQQLELDQSKQTRQANVDKLSTEVTTSTEKLEKLKQDRSRLNALIKEIALQAERLRKLEEQRIAEEKKRAEEQAKNNQTPVKPVVRELVEGGFIKQRGLLM